MKLPIIGAVCTFAAKAKSFSLSVYSSRSSRCTGARKDDGILSEISTGMVLIV